MYICTMSTHGNVFTKHQRKYIRINSMLIKIQVRVKIYVAESFTTTLNKIQ